jgi:uncharacterized coiled-coil DUF342 family protein
MADNEPLKPFGKATTRELVEESRRLRKQAEELRMRIADLHKVIDERARRVTPPDEPPQ